jgi:hypothetical protein
VRIPKKLGGRPKKNCAHVEKLLSVQKNSAVVSKILCEYAKIEGQFKKMCG